MKFLCDQCKAKYQIADEKIAGKTVRMKCRKCGHHIEVRAEVTESSVSSKIGVDPPTEREATPEGEAPVGARTPPPPRPATAPQKPLAPQAGPRAMGPLATSLAAARPSPPRAAPAPPSRNERPGALAGAFQREVKERDEISASFDLAELSVVDEWYVAINGVPVGPIRVSEVRRKAALGAVTEDSLAWQEGLEEWRPIRSFGELAAVVREAVAAGRASIMTPAPPDVRQSVPPPGAATWSTPQRTGGSNARSSSSNAPRPSSGASTAAALAAQAPTPSQGPSGRSSVIPLAPAVPLIAQDPFASLAPAAPAPSVDAVSGPPTGPAVTRPSLVEIPARKQAPWMAIAMIVLAGTFGVTAAIAIFTRQPAPVVIQMPSATAPQPAVAEPPPVPTETATAAAPSAATTNGKSGAVAMQGNPGSKPPAAPTSTGLGLDLGSLKHGSVSPVGDDSQGTRAPGQCLTSGQVSSVIANYQSGIRRTCWERGGGQKASANVSVLVSVGPNGNVDNANASGDDPTIASCIASNVRSWRFPAMGCSQQVNIPFHFVRQ